MRDFEGPHQRRLGRHQRQLSTLSAARDGYEGARARHTCAVTLYDRVAATPDGSRRLAEARLRREVLRLLHWAYIESGLSSDRLATKLGVRPRAIRRIFDRDKDITVATLARYLHAMGYEAEIRLVAAGEPRRKAIEGRSSWEQIADTSGFVDVSALAREDLRRQEQAAAEEGVNRLLYGNGENASVQLRIDLNARTHDGHVPAAYNNAERPLRRGDNVIVYEPDDGVATTATVMRVYGDWVHLDVDWDYMVDITAGYDETADHSYRDKVNAPLRPETIAALNARLVAGNMPTVVVPRRKAVEGQPEP